MSNRLYILLITLAATIGPASFAAAQGADWWERPLLERSRQVDAERILESALHQEKGLGRADSAVVGYRRVLTLYRQRRATATAAARARARLQVLEAAGVQTALDESPAAGLPGRLSVGGAVSGVVQLAHGLQRGTASVAEPDPGPAAPRRVRIDPLSARRRWLERATRLQSARQPLVRNLRPDWIETIGSGIGALRAALGLRGVQYYVDMELRRRRARPFSAHEQLLSALLAEKEHKDFGGAEGRYHELVQLSLTGGIATRLSERARQGVARCQRWQRAVPAGS